MNRLALVFSVGFIVVLLLAACQRQEQIIIKVVCPVVQQYDKKLMNRALEEYRRLPADSAIKQLLGDYKVLYERVRACRENMGEAA